MSAVSERAPEPLSLEEVLADKIQKLIETLLASDEAGELQGAEIERIGLTLKVNKDGISRSISIPHWRPTIEKDTDK